jgi:gliding motility-associated-like protein
MNKNTHLLLLISCILFNLLKTNAQDCTVNAGSSKLFCIGQVVTLSGFKNGTFAAGTTSKWSQISGPSVVIAYPNSSSSAGTFHTTSISGFTKGVYVFQFTGNCNNGFNSSQKVTYTISGTSTANAGSDISICPGSTATLSGNTFASSETSFWTIAATSGTPGLTTVLGTNTTLGLVFKAANDVDGGTTTYRYNITNSLCTSSDDVIVTARGGNTSVSAGTNLTLNSCYSTTQRIANLAGSRQGIASTNGVWTQVSGPNNATFGNVSVRNTSLDNLVQGIYTIKWTVRNSNCFDGSNTIDINVPAPSQAVTQSSNITSSYCQPVNSIVLKGVNPLYTNEVINWTTVSGPAGVVIQSPEASSTSVTGLNGSSTYVFKYTIKNTLSGCTSTSNYTVNYRTATPVVTLKAGATSINNSLTVLGCGIKSAVIGFSSSQIGTTDRWQIINGPVTTFATNAGSTFTANMPIAGTYYIRGTSQVTGTNVIGTCLVGMADARIEVSLQPVEALPGTNPSVDCQVFTCQPSSVYGINNPTGLIGKWSQVSGPNIANFSNPFVNNPLISGMINGKYVFRWTMSGGSGCSPVSNDIIATVASTAAGVSNAGLNQTLCSSAGINLNGNTPSQFESGFWTISPSTSGLNFSSINEPTPKVSGMQSGFVYTVNWTLYNSCSSNSSSATVELTTIAGPVPAQAGTDICRIGAFTTATLSGNNPEPLGATGLWTQLSGPTTATFVNSNTVGGAALANLVAGTYQFEWRLEKGECNATRDTVQVTIALTTVPSANAGSDINVCGSVVRLAATANPSSITGLWTQIAGEGGAMLANASNFNSSITGLADGGVYVFRWTLSNGACGTSTDDVTVRSTYPNPSIVNAGNDQTICGLSSTLLSATGVSGTWIWSGIGSAPSVINYVNGASSAVTSITGLETGIYTFRGTNFGSSFCPSNTDDVIISVAKNADATIGGTTTSTASYCNTNSLILEGNTGTTGLWSVISGIDANVVSVSGNTANVAGLNPGIYVFRYTNNPLFGCSATSKDINVTISGTGTTPDAGSDQMLCGATSTTLLGNNPAFGTGTWSLISGSITGFIPTILGANLPNATILGLVPGVEGTTLSGVYVFQWNVANGACGNFSDIVRINTYATPSTPTASILGANISNLCSNVITLSGNNISNGIGKWSLVSGPSTPVFANVNNSVTEVSGIAAGTNIFSWTATNGTCPAKSDNITIVSIINCPPKAPNLTIVGFEDLVTIETITGWVDQNNTSPTVTGIGSTFTASQSGNYTVIGFVNDFSSTIIRYLPALNFNGIETSSYSVCDNLGACVTAQIVFSVIGINDAPIALNDFTTTSMNTPVTLLVLNNDSDVDGFIVTSTLGIVTQPSIGSVVENTLTGSVTYTPNATFEGITSFIYSVCDNQNSCVTATGFINVTNKGADTPFATNLTFSGIKRNTIFNGTISGCSDPQNSPLTFITQVLTKSGGGILTVFDNGTFIYKPKSDFKGIDCFNYSVCNQSSVCATGNICLIYNWQNQSPEAIRDVFNLDRNTTTFKNDATTSILQNDSDPDGNLVISIRQNNTATIHFGLFSLDTLGNITYEIPTGFVGIDSVSYTIKDINGATASNYVVFVIPDARFVPEGFSPNDDKINDFWIIPHPDTVKLKVEIFNRWGDTVYKAEEFSSWNGKSNVGIKVGQGVPDGTYFYHIEYSDSSVGKTGYITLSR